MLSIAKRMVKREGRRQRPIQLATVVSIGTDNEDTDDPRDASIGYVSEHGFNLDVVLFPSWLRRITRKPVERSWTNLLCS